MPKHILTEHYDYDTMMMKYWCDTCFREFVSTFGHDQYVKEYGSNE